MRSDRAGSAGARRDRPRVRFSAASRPPPPAARRERPRPAVDPTRRGGSRRSGRRRAGRRPARPARSAQSPKVALRLPDQVARFQSAGAVRSALPIGSRSPLPGRKRLKSRMPCSSGETPVTIVVQRRGERGGCSLSSAKRCPAATSRASSRHLSFRDQPVEELPVRAVEPEDDERRPGDRAFGDGGHRARARCRLGGERRSLPGFAFAAERRRERDEDEEEAHRDHRAILAASPGRESGSQARTESPEARPIPAPPGTANRLVLMSRVDRHSVAGQRLFGEARCRNIRKSSGEHASA